jgi:hypothetical protein
MKDINRDTVNAYLDIIETINALIDKADQRQDMKAVDALCDVIIHCKIELANIVTGNQNIS